MSVPGSLALLEWLPPWEPAEPGLEDELTREVGSRHPLKGRKAISVGRRADNDDVLFYLPGCPALLAVVHLTWSGRRERDPRLPSTVLYESVRAWESECMRPDHHEFKRAAQ